MNNHEGESHVADQLKKVISIVWYGQLVVSIGIYAFFYFVIPDMKIGGGVPAEYDNYLFIAGVLSGAGALFYKRYFGELLRSNRSLPDDEFWNLVKVKMMPGIALAELPFFIGGLTTYMLFGNQQAYLILGVYSLTLFFVVKPPTEKP